MICMVGLAGANIENGHPDINIEITPYIATETVNEETGEVTVIEDWGNTIEYSMEFEDNLGDIDIEFYDYDVESENIKLKINGNKWFCDEGDEKIVYGSDAILNVGDFRIGVVDVFYYGEVDDDDDDDDVFGASNDVPVEVYIQLSNGETKTLGQLDDSDDEADVLKLDSYSKDDWFDSNFDSDEVKLFIERIDDDAKITDVDLISPDADFDDYENVKNNDNLIFYTLEENGHYILLITYEENKLWGDEDETDVYFKLNVTGLDKDGDGVVNEDAEVLFTDTKSMVEGNSFTKTLAVDGEWAETGGMSVVKTQSGENYNYRFTAQVDGTYTPEFTSVDGDTGTIEFIVSAKPTSSNNGVTTNNTNNNNNNNNAGNTANQNPIEKFIDNKIAIGLLGVFAIIAIGIILTKGGNGGNGGNGSTTSSSLIDREGSILNVGGEDE